MTEAFFRSTHTDVIAVWEDTQRRWREVHDAIGVFANRFDRQARVHRSGYGYSIASLDGPKPEGPWRETERGWVPHRGSKAGKELGKEFDALSVRNLGRVPGMPYDIIELKTSKWLSPGLRRAGGAVWATWACPPEDVEHQKVFDGTLWERAKASEYYLAVEGEEELSGAAHG